MDCIGLDSTGLDQVADCGCHKWSPQVLPQLLAMGGWVSCLESTCLDPFADFHRPYPLLLAAMDGCRFLDSTGLALVAGREQTSVAPGVTCLAPVAGFHRPCWLRVDRCRAWIHQALPRLLAAGGQVSCLDSPGVDQVTGLGWTGAGWVDVVPGFGRTHIYIYV